MIKLFKNINKNNITLFKYSNSNNVISRFYCSDIVSGSGGKSIDYTKIIPENGNIPSTILNKIGKNLHSQNDHPLNIIKKKIQYHFQQVLSDQEHKFQFFDSFQPKVSVTQNFDDLLFPVSHIGRSPNDTYYFNKDNVLRTHTSAHQSELLKNKEMAFLVTGDVYRRDTIDSVHYPVFHQMEGVKVFKNLKSIADYNSSIDYYKDQAYMELDDVKFVESDLKHSLESMIRGVIGQDLQVRWIDAYFPFTSPSWEMEILFQGEWLEVLGCGVVHPKIMNDTGLSNYRAWAFGIGLERLAMILFNIPDIRLFWTDDKRFHNQFKGIDKSTSTNTIGDIDITNIKFQQFSKYPSCTKDISFWIEDAPAASATTAGAGVNQFHENKFYEFVRETCGDLVEKVELVDSFTNNKLNKTSHCYRIHYRSMDRNLTNEEIDQVQSTLRNKVENHLSVKLR